MKSYFFSISSWDKDEKTDFEDFLKTDQELFEKILEWFAQQNELPEINKEILEKFAKGTIYDANLINNVIKVIYKILYIFSEDKNKYEDVLSDLKQIFKDSDVVNEVSLKRIIQIYEISKIYKTYFLMSNTENLGGPQLSSVTGTVVLKPVFNTSFSYDEDIENYDPSIIKYLPTILLSLKRGESKEAYSFQMTSDEFNRLLNELLSLQVELKKVIDYDRKK